MFGSRPIVFGSVSCSWKARLIQAIVCDRHYHRSELQARPLRPRKRAGLPAFLKRAFIISSALVLGAIIAFVQGYTFVPVYRLIYVVLYFAAMQRFGAGHKPKGHLSYLSIVCEVMALVAASALLLLPYNLYFLFEEVPDNINTVWFSGYFVGFIFYRGRQELTLQKKRANQRVYVDLNRIDRHRRIILESFWTLFDLERLLISLDRGGKLNVYGYTGEGENKKVITAAGTVLYDNAKKRWVLDVPEEQHQDFIQAVRIPSQEAQQVNGPPAP